VRGHRIVPAARAAVVAGILAVAVVACGTAVSTPAAPSATTTEGSDMSAPTPSDPLALDRLREAIDSGDPDRVADCFTADFRADLPHHPERSFTGAQRVQANWTAIFARAPHLTANVLRTAVNGAEIWSEWEITGVDTAGTPVTFAGPVIVTTRDGRINWARFYLDPVIPG
jgi:ketosteroid isomerase-like protein